MGYQIAFDKAIADIKAKNPVAVCANADVEYSTALYQYCVTFFGRPYIVDVENGVVFNKSTGNRCPTGTGLLILHYLIYAQGFEPSGQWITLKEVRHGGAFFYPAFQNQVLDTIANAFQYDLSAFERAAALLGGKQIRMGDKASVFAALPRIPLAVVMWQADEELGGSASILYDKTVEYFAPVETIIAFGYYLSHKLLSAPFLSGVRKGRDPVWDDEV